MLLSSPIAVFPRGSVDPDAFKELLVRNVPENVSEWIDKERQQHRMSQQEFVLSVLQKASVPIQNLPLPFEQIRPDRRPVRLDLPFTFIDLFAGIGGFRIALEGVGGGCAFSSEWDKYSQKTYKAWFKERGSARRHHQDQASGDSRSRHPSGGISMPALLHRRGIKEEEPRACPRIQVRHARHAVLQYRFHSRSEATARGVAGECEEPPVSRRR